MPDIYLHLDGEQKGPYQPDQVRQFVAQGKATGETPAWYQGLSEWSTVHLVLAAFSAAAVPPPPPALPLLPHPVAPRKGLSGGAWAAIIVGGFFLGIFVLSCLAGIALGPITKGIEKAKESMSLQQSRQIGLAMFTYAGDHNGDYPTGATSTEVFQKLLDEKYITNPAAFYFLMPGKVPASSNKLTAQNVCFDVTSGVSSRSSNEVPLVFATGYNITYSPNAIAEPDPAAKPAFPGIAVTYKSNNARFLNAQPDGTVPGVISSTFDPGGQSYQQLKP